MFAIGPATTAALMVGRFSTAAAIGDIGVFAKEFAAAPLYAFAAYAFVERRWLAAVRAIVAANAAFIVWALLTLTLMLRFDYTYGWNGNGSADFAHGAALALWMQHQSARGIAFAMFNEFGALYLLAPPAFSSRPDAAPDRPRLAAVCRNLRLRPAARSWFVEFPLSGRAARRLGTRSGLRPSLAWATLVSFAVGNLRVGAQLPIAGVARGRLRHRSCWQRSHVCGLAQRARPFPPCSTKRQGAVA